VDSVTILFLTFFLDGFDKLNQVVKSIEKKCRKRMVTESTKNDSTHIICDVGSVIQNSPVSLICA